MNFLALITAASVSALSALSPEESERAADLYRSVLRDPRDIWIDHARTDALSEEDRQLVIAHIHDKLELSRTQGMLYASLRFNYGRNLASLGDQWGLDSIAKEIRHWPRGNLREIFGYVRNAKLIPMVGDLLFKEEEYEAEDDLSFAPTQVVIAEGVILTLKYSSQFLPDIQQWARQLWGAGASPGDEIVNILREWYRANEEKLRAGAFKDIRPGRTPKPTVSTASAAGVPANAPQMPPAPPVSIPASVAAVPQAEPKGYLVEIIAAAAVGLLGVLIFLWKRRT